MRHFEETSMTARLEDILGGVEEEIRRAETRLQMNSFGLADSAGTHRPASTNRAKRLSPRYGSGPFRHSDGTSVIALREPARAAGTDGSAPQEGSSDRRDPAGRVRSTRRRAWADLTNECPAATSCQDDITDSAGSDSARGREAMVTRLLQERAARLRLPLTITGATSSRRALKGIDIGLSAGGIDTSSRISEEHSDPRDTSLRVPQERSHASEDDHPEVSLIHNVSPRPEGESPTSNLGNIFFASDVLGVAAEEEDCAGAESPVGDVTDWLRACDLEDDGEADVKDRVAVDSADGRKPDGREPDDATARLETRLSFCPRAGKRSPQRSEAAHARTTAGLRIKELARNRRDIYSERERKRRELQHEAETKECTFQPKLVSRENFIGVDEVGADELERRRPPLHERLHREAREREAARALAQHHLEAQVLRECTFQPTLSGADASASAGQPPLHRRLWEIEREREHKLRLLQADREKREGATFAPPPLGRVSQRLTRDRTGVGSEGQGRGVTARLQEEAKWAKERRRLRMQEHEEAEARTSTFVPSINQSTRSLIRRRPELQAPFEERRAIMDAKMRARRQRRLAARAEEEQRWFRPTTARRTETLLRRHMPQRLEETVQERVSRMASTQDYRRREYINAQRAMERRECTFQPNLNQVTHLLGHAAPLDELVKNRRGQRARERAQAKARESEMGRYKPILVAEAALMEKGPKQGPVPPASSTAYAEGGAIIAREPEDGPTDEGARNAASEMYGPGNKYRLNLREPGKMIAELRTRERNQEQKVYALRQEQETREMEPCTFRPRTNDGIVRAQGPVIVRGLGRHLELKVVAQQMEESRREREAKAFSVRPGAVSRNILGETVLKPFSLSEGNSKAWWGERRRRHEQERAAECTFKPWTIEGERSKALSRLLDCSSSVLSFCEAE